MFLRCRHRNQTCHVTKSNIKHFLKLKNIYIYILIDFSQICDLQHMVKRLKRNEKKYTIRNSL